MPTVSRGLVPSLSGLMYILVSTLTGCGSSSELVPKSVRALPRDPDLHLDSHGQPWFSTTGLGHATIVSGADSGRRMLRGKMRFLEMPDGSNMAASSLLPNSDQAIQPIPERLGGGFLLLSGEDSLYKLWKFDTWLGTPRELLRFREPPITTIIGFDTVLVRLASGNILCVSPSTGAVSRCGGLPPVPHYGTLVFLDAWRAVAEVELLGIMLTLDGGQTWNRVDVPGPLFGATTNSRGQIILNRRYQLDELGQVTPVNAAPPSPSVPIQQKALDSILRDFVTRGYPSSKTLGWVARQGRLFQVHRDTGQVVSESTHSFPRSWEPCQVIPFEKGLATVCTSGGTRTSIHRILHDGSLHPTLAFDELRAVFPSESGSLVIRGACPDRKGSTRKSSYCLRNQKGEFRGVSIHGDGGVERVVPMDGDRVAILIPPRLGLKGRMLIVDGGSSKVVEFAPREMAPRQQELLGNGSWIHGAFALDANTVGAWVVAGDRIAGVRIQMDGSVTVGAIHRGSETFTSGRFAMTVGSEGAGSETVDGGKTWTPLFFPEAPEFHAGRDQGCSPLGCAVGQWVRVGWGRQDEAASVASAKEWVSGNGAQQTLQCYRKGQSPSNPPKIQPAARPSSGRFGYRQWEPCWSVPTPKLAPNETGLTVQRTSGSYQMCAQAWGPENGDWSVASRTRTVVQDPFVLDSPWVTGEMHTPWPDPETAYRALSDTRLIGSSRDRRTVLTANCETSPCTHELLRENQPSVALTALDRAHDSGSITDAVETNGTWYVLARASGLLSIFKVESSKAEQVAAFPSTLQGGVSVQLTQHSHRSRMGLVLQDGNLFGGTMTLVPIDASDGQIASIHVVDLATASRELRTCGADDQGWILTTTLNRIRTALKFEGALQVTTDGFIRMRYDPSSARMCVETIAARGNVGGPAEPSSISGTVSVIATDRDTEKKVAFSCSMLKK